MRSSPVDPSLARQEASASELTRRKMDMDALRKRLGDVTTKQEKLRESCEGFEAIFLQKMWEQMRKTVPKEGFLHSKDEEMYQSLFDIELCKKMAGAGGIGLADMLYAQLSRQFEHTGRSTTPGRFRNPLNVPPSDHLSPQHAIAPSVASSERTDKKMLPENLYSPLPEREAEPDEAPPQTEAPAVSAVDEALKALKTELGLPREDEKGAAVAEWAATRAVMTGTAPPAGQEAAAAVPGQGAATPEAAAAAPGQVAAAPGPAAAGQPLAGAELPPAGRTGTEPASRERPSSQNANPALSSWQGNGPVSGKTKPVSAFGRNNKGARSGGAEKAAPARTRGAALEQSVWPLEGMVTNRFGWEDDVAAGKRRWNSGITIAAPADSPVRAVLAGRVVYAGQREGYGNTVVLEHKEGYRSYYSNLQQTKLKVGDKIQHGANFAKIATQPSSLPEGENSAFLHFELKRGEMALNPENAIRRMATASSQ